MLIFWRLILGHLLSDFTFQSNYINSWKRRSLLGMLVHCGMHSLFYVFLTWSYLTDVWVRNRYFQLRGWTCIFLITLFHFIEDEWRVYNVRRYQSQDNTLYFLWDQVIHYVCLFVFLPIGMFDQRRGWFPEKWPVVLSLVIGATHFCGVFVSFLEKDFYASELPDFDEQYLAMAERLVLVCCILFPGAWWWLFLAAGWIANMAYMRRRRVVDFSWFSFYLGGGIAALCGLLGRMIWYSGS